LLLLLRGKIDRFKGLGKLSPRYQFRPYLINCLENFLSFLLNRDNFVDFHVVENVGG